MASKNTAAFGIYQDTTSAERAVGTLESAGFSRSDISVLTQDSRSSKDFAHEKHTKAPEGTTTGVTTGGLLGGTLGLLAGIGALAIPGVGPFIAAGPIMGALAGLGVGGAVGGLVGALVGLGIPEYEAKRYEGRIKNGGVLLSVHCDTSDEVSRAKDLLKQTGAEDISSTGEKGVGHHDHDHVHDSNPVTRAGRAVEHGVEDIGHRTGQGVRNLEHDVTGKRDDLDTTTGLPRTRTGGNYEV